MVYAARPPPLLLTSSKKRVVAIAELCRREGLAKSQYNVWSKEFLEAGKRRLAGDTARAATTDEVKGLRHESTALKEVVAEQALEIQLLKKSMIADDEAAQLCRGHGEHRMTTNEVSHRRESRDHQDRRTIAFISEQNAGADWRATRHILPPARLPVPPAQIDARYDQYQTGGPEALEDRVSQPSRVWNRIPEEIRTQILELALNPSYSRAW